MTLIVSVERYQVITGDTTSDGGLVSARIEDAQGLLADELARPGITLGEYTETLPLSPAGTAYPSVTPVTVPPTGVDYVLGGFDGCSIDGSPFPVKPYTTTVTYTAGWDAATAPNCVIYDLAWAAYRLGHMTPPAAGGATQVSVGDVSVTYPEGAPAGVDAVTWSDETKRYRRRRM